MTYRKKLIEVALPLDAINKASAREKSIRHGHPSTLHLWWARRPLAACRAALFASLVDDPDDDPMFGGDEDLAATKRAKLFDLIEELVKWENSNNPRVINKARAEIARCVSTQKIEDRLSQSVHQRVLVLKGAMLFQLWSRTRHRAACDVDFLAWGDSSAARFERIFGKPTAERARRVLMYRHLRLGGL